MNTNTKLLLRTGTTILASSLLAIPSALSEGGSGVTGITAEAVPNAVVVLWNAPSGMNIGHYKVYFAKTSILAGNGRFDGSEETLGNETSIAILDLKNRGLEDGKTLYLTVTAVDSAGHENLAFAEETSVRVNIPGSNAGAPMHSIAEGSIGLEQALSLNLTTVELRFSAPVRVPDETPGIHFAIREESTGNPVGVVAVSVAEEKVTLTTLPMTLRQRYTVSTDETITAEDGSALDPMKRQAPFVARGEEGGNIPEIPLPPPPPPDTTPPEPPSALKLRRTLQSDGKYRVDASWRESLNTARDLLSYNLYESKDKGNSFVGPTALQATIVSATIADVPPGTLTVKVTAMDQIGNESQGITETIILPATGPGLALALSALGAGAWAVRRKRGRRVSCDA